jgi:hypothetical protein
MDHDILCAPADLEMKRCSLPSLLLAGACLSASIATHADEVRLVSTPPLGDALPLVETPEGVRLKFPVLLNDHVVVGPDALLRLVYINPNAGLRLHAPGGGGEGQGFQSGGGHHHSGGFQKPMDNDGFGEGASPGVTYDPDYSTQKTASKEMGSEIWKQAAPFRQALDAAADLGTTLVYSVTGKPKPGYAEIDLPGGMLLGENQNQITVLALTTDSEARSASLQPGDEIRSVDGQPVSGSLEQFMHVYRATTEQARKTGQSYSFAVWRPAESKLVTITVGAPPSIPSMF